MTIRVLDLSYLNSNNDLTWSEIFNRIFVMLPHYGYHCNGDREFSFTCPDRRTLCVFNPYARTVEVDWNLEPVMQLKATMAYFTEGLEYCKGILNAWYVEDPTPCSLKDIVEDGKPAIFPKYAADEEPAVRTIALSYSGSITSIVDAMKSNYKSVNVARYLGNTDIVELTGCNAKKKAACRFVIDKYTKVLVTDKGVDINILRDYYYGKGQGGHAYHIFD